MSEHTSASAGAPLLRHVSVERRFNHDLLRDDQDRAVVRARWPAIERLLVNEPLIAQFALHERRARWYKWAAHWVGTFAVVAMLASLASAALYLASGASSAGGAVHTWMELLGVAGVGLAVLASRWGPLRPRWLASRFFTEVLRQWHFRWLLHRVPPEPTERDVELRDQEFLALVHGLSGSVGQKMDRLMEVATDPLPPIPEAKLPSGGPARKQLLEAYEQLRLKHQIDFAVYKLSSEDRTFALCSNRVLVLVTDAFAALTLIVALVCSTLPLLENVASARAVIEEHAATLAIASVLCAILGVAVRAWRDGLSLGEERERYQEVLHRLELVQELWRSAPDDDARFALSRELEQAALRELRVFLREHERAQFLF
jgi:hypothetical protein